jgi:hypothetical protein
MLIAKPSQSQVQIFLFEHAGQTSKVARCSLSKLQRTLKLRDFRSILNNHPVAARIAASIYQLNAHDYELPTSAMPFRTLVASN